MLYSVSLMVSGKQRFIAVTMHCAVTKSSSMQITISEGWTISLLNRETVPLSAEMLKPHKVKQKFFFHIKLALILNGHLAPYRFFPGETNKILGEMLHPFLHLQGQMEKV